MKWISQTIKAERRRLERARRCFLKEPTEDRLHDMRTTGRRLRSLLEDVSQLAPHPKLQRRVKRAATVTDAARDAAVLSALLERVVDESERELAGPLFEELRRREDLATSRACRRLTDMDFS